MILIGIEVFGYWGMVVLRKFVVKREDIESFSYVWKKKSCNKLLDKGS